MLIERGNSIAYKIINKGVLLSVQLLKYFEKLLNQNLRVKRISKTTIPNADYSRSKTTGEHTAYVFVCFLGLSILFSVFVLWLSFCYV